MPTILRSKCVIAGDATVGKTALTQVFYSDGAHFPKSYTTTTGVDLQVKTVHIPESEYSVELYLYDSAGKDLYSNIVSQCWSNANAVIIVFDVTSETSFAACEKWLNGVKHALATDTLCGVLVANKVDLVDRRVVSQKDGKNLANKLQLDYTETSARDNVNADGPFHLVANTVLDQYKKKNAHLMTL